MELVEGECLGERLEREGRFSEDEALRIIVQVSHGLHRAHRQGLIHRDIKPDNIMLTSDGKAKVLDLGLAKDVEGAMELTATGRGLGTPNFMAPEQFRNAKHVDIRSDVYSLAATLYQLVTGEVPFGEGDPVQLMMRMVKNELPSPRSLVPSLSERTDWTIRRAMSARPDSRPATCREFVEDLLGQSTRPSSRFDVANAPPDGWFLVFKDRDGAVRTAQGDLATLRQSITKGKLGPADRIRASQSATGPFELLTTFSEFRDLVGPAAAPPLTERTLANLSRLNGAGNPTRLDDAAAFRKPVVRVDEDSPEPLTSGQAHRADTVRGRGTAPQPNGPARAVDTVKPIKPVAPPALATADLPHFQMATPPANAAGASVPLWLQAALLVVLTAVTTLLLSRFLLPLVR
jgi:serine/threonine protein kinase